VCSRILRQAADRRAKKNSRQRSVGGLAAIVPDDWEHARRNTHCENAQAAGAFHSPMAGSCCWNPNVMLNASALGSINGAKPRRGLPSTYRVGVFSQGHPLRSEPTTGALPRLAAGFEDVMLWQRPMSRRACTNPVLVRQIDR
jgi:hypothetical protein